MKTSPVNPIIFILFILALMFASLNTAPAQASWLIDLPRYQNGVHAELSCRDCHQDITVRELHPDPRNFDGHQYAGPDVYATCLSCHDQVAADLEQGMHGFHTVDDPSDYHNCADCHHPHYEVGAAGPVDTLPPDHDCLACHQTPNYAWPAEHARVQALCFHCHGDTVHPAQELTAQTSALVAESDFMITAHADLACLMCHHQAAEANHAVQQTADCRQCHTPHAEKVAHDPHLIVSCEACHLPDVTPIRSADGRIVWERPDSTGGFSTIHDLVRSRDAAHCLQCHTPGNTVGASAMLLPPKSMLCMPCHAATFSLGDRVSQASLAVFGIGILMIFSYLLSATLPQQPHAGTLGKLGYLMMAGLGAVFSPRIVIIMKAFFWDVLLQRRLYRRSPKRWLIHSLIFLPFVIRLTWGLVGLLASLWSPEWPLTWVLLDKNHPATALIHDLTGLAILIGVTWAFIRHYRPTGPTPPADLSRPDLIALVLIGALTVAGFIVEGARIAMTGWPPQAEWAFIGYALSTIFAPFEVTGIYGYLWYLHAILGGAFIAYLPFSRLLHIILAPITLAMLAVDQEQHDRPLYG